MVDVEQRLRDLLTDDHLAIRVRTGAVDAVHTGVRRRRRRARIATGVGVVTVAAAVATAVVVAPALLNRTAHVSSAGPSGDAIDRWNPGPVTALPPTLTAPSALAISGGLVWVAGPAQSGSGDALARIDAASGVVTTAAAGGVTDLAATPLHLWVASRCSLQLRETTRGDIVSTFPLPCDGGGGTAPIVTANGGHAWVATDDGTRTRLRLYTVGAANPTERVLSGRLGGPHLLAIGGTSVYVVTVSPTDGTVVHQLSAADLTPEASIAVPGARLMAYGSGQLFVADGDQILAFAADLGTRRTLFTGPVATLTTGNGVVWCESGGAAVVGLDPRTGKVIEVADLAGGPSGLLRADGPVLWSVGTYDGIGLGVRSARPAG